ncbi:hypothetical protein DINM_004072 [Dirofilaria immitis]|nr:hypothetical protein [Dirofilaria immitis]
MVIFNDISHTKRSDMRLLGFYKCFGYETYFAGDRPLLFVIAFYCFSVLVLRKTETEITSSIFHADEEELVNKKERFFSLVILKRIRITFNFLDYMDREIIRFSVIPGAAEFQLACAKQDIDHITFPNNDYEKYYEFIIVFSSVGIMSIFSIRLTDRNGITAITVTVDYRKDTFIKRAKLDSGNNPCINFGNSLDFTSLITTRIQIAILPYLYKVGIILNKGARNVWCSIPGHHLSPYDIRQVILHSTNNNFIAYAYYIIMH